MSQSITIVLDEKEFAVLQRRAAAEQRAPDELACAIMAEQLAEYRVAVEPQPCQSEIEQMRARPIEEIRALAGQAAGSWNEAIEGSGRAAEIVRRTRIVEFEREMAEQLAMPTVPLPEGFLPYEIWERKVKEEWDRIMALPIEERRALALGAAGNLKLPDAVNVIQSVRELRADWEHQLPPP